MLSIILLLENYCISYTAYRFISNHAKVYNLRHNQKNLRENRKIEPGLYNSLRGTRDYDDDDRDLDDSSNNNNDNSNNNNNNNNNNSVIQEFSSKYRCRPHVHWS